MTLLSLMLELPADKAAYFAELSEQSYKSLPEVHDAFRELLTEATSHPFRSQVTPQMEEMLSAFEQLPKIDLDSLPDEARPVIKGRLMQSAVMVGFINGWYEAMSEEA